VKLAALRTPLDAVDVVRIVGDELTVLELCDQRLFAVHDASLGIDSADRVGELKAVSRVLAGELDLALLQILQDGARTPGRLGGVDFDGLPDSNRLSGSGRDLGSGAHETPSVKEGGRGVNPAPRLA
jgi:hypothetical protein